MAIGALEDDHVGRVLLSGLFRLRFSFSFISAFTIILALSLQSTLIPNRISGLTTTQARMLAPTVIHLMPFIHGSIFYTILMHGFLDSTLTIPHSQLFVLRLPPAPPQWAAVERYAGLDGAIKLIPVLGSIRI